MLKISTIQDLVDEGVVELPPRFIFQSCTHEFVDGDGDYYTTSIFTSEETALRVKFIKFFDAETADVVCYKEDQDVDAPIDLPC